MKKHLPLITKILVIFFACIGLIFVLVFIAMQFGLLNVRGSIQARNQFFTTKQLGNAGAPLAPSAPVCDADIVGTCAWNTTPEWEVVKNGLYKDTAILLRVAEETGVSPRMIAAVVVPEQTRFFTANREVFKRYFEPLKILGSMTQFSLGVSGIKQETAQLIEKYSSDTTSEFYPGEGMDKLIAYDVEANKDSQLYNRLTDDKDHYYSYLYAALFIKQIESQWKRAGFDVSDKPEVIVTLFNIGFAHSKPNANPQVAGAEIVTGGKSYVYGQLGALFYRSDELVDQFPRK